MKQYLFLLTAIIFEVVGTSLLKTSEQFTKPIPTVASLLCYGLAFYLLSLTLRTMPVGVAYAIWSGVGIVLVSMVAWVVYKQSLDLPAIVGMMLIVAGVAVINLCSKSVG